jgi:hypothetical protein
LVSCGGGRFKELLIFNFRRGAAFQRKAGNEKIQREPGQHHVTVTGSVAVLLDGMFLPKCREHRRLPFSVIPIKPQLTLMLPLMGGAMDHALHYESACLGLPVRRPAWDCLNGGAATRREVAALVSWS